NVAPTSTNGKGGSISLTGDTVSAFSGTLALDASASGTGTGGSIHVTLSNDLATRVIDNGGDFTLTATGGSGGSVSLVTQQGSLAVNMAAINVTPTSVNGNGGNIGLGGVSVTRVGGGTLVINTSAQAGGTGSGGEMTIAVTDFSTATISSAV